jgi:lipoyl(octanoyl) transferase
MSVSAGMKVCDLLTPGTVRYRDAVELQERCVQAVARGENEKLILLEHPHVITLGRGFHAENLLFTTDWLRENGVDVEESGRGGDVTYHGPGQVVGYPILNISDRPDLHSYLRNLEEWMIRCVADFGIQAGRKPGLTGIWVHEEKIGAIGVRVSRWITSHGFALNVNTDLTRFEYIIPCGIRQHGVTSMDRLLNRPVSMQQVHQSLMYHFEAIFQRKVSIND